MVTDITNEQIAEALSVACEAAREGDLQDLDTVARNLELSDEGILEALRAGLDYMLELDGQREGWGVFTPLCEIGNKVYPAPISRVSPSWLPIWVRAFSCAPYSFVQARFADLLWEAKYGEERYKWGRRAADAYLLALDEPFGEEVDLAEGACRALSLTRQLGDKTRQSSAIAALRDLVRRDIDNADISSGVTLRSLSALVDLRKEHRPDGLGNLIDAVLQHEQPYYVRLGGLRMKSKLAETQEEQRTLWEAQVNAHADEGRLKEGLARYKHFQDAIQLAERHGLKDLANQLQQEAGPLSEDAFERVETQVEIPASDMDAYIGAFVGDDSLWDALGRFGLQIPSGDPEENRASAQENFSMRSLFTNLITGEHGELIKQVQTREEFEEYQVVWTEAYNINFFAATAVLILKAIRQRYGPLGASAKVFESDLVDETQAEWIALAVQHYEAGDYRSCVSILALRLENAIRGLAGKLGIPILRDSRGGQRVGGVKDLGGVLSELEGRMHEGVRRYWRTLLVESLGLNLRDRVAHGLIDDPTSQEAAILIHAACQLRILSIKESSEET
ncbi:MAG: hypothetical protein OXM57_14390 [bacterium]|nr:hypothetical protein [bacterium]MDE0601378.1 hypothetical protein [bacterium]